MGRWREPSEEEVGILVEGVDFPTSNIDTQEDGDALDDSMPKFVRNLKVLMLGLQEEIVTVGTALSKGTKRSERQKIQSSKWKADASFLVESPWSAKKKVECGDATEASDGTRSKIEVSMCAFQYNLEFIGPYSKGLVGHPRVRRFRTRSWASFILFDGVGRCPLFLSFCFLFARSTASGWCFVQFCLCSLAESCCGLWFFLLNVVYPPFREKKVKD